MAMNVRVTTPEEVIKKLVEISKEYDAASHQTTGEGLRAIFRKRGEAILAMTERPWDGAAQMIALEKIADACGLIDTLVVESSEKKN